jgi:uncharacterized protein YprB with RNaseH-like and TPR domain
MSIGLSSCRRAEAVLERAYLDIETSYGGEITVVGIFRPPDELTQIVHPDISVDSVLEALDGAREVITYWGHRFDLPVINRRLGLNLRDIFESRDLADHCHRHGLYGGLKVIEQVLGIARQSDGITGTDAMRLWEAWCLGDREALKVLLRYNEDDVVNLYLLEKELLELDIRE